jgi:Raf kinase inhibitor-like YbhB/YbcL family protein
MNMARIRIDDLPVAEDLTPEQEALLQGAGLKSFRPSLEGLEDRFMPAVVSALVDVKVGEGENASTVRTLKITGDETQNKVTVSQRAGDVAKGEAARVVVVTGTHVLGGNQGPLHREIYDASKIDEIVFDGGGTSKTGAGQDTFTNKTGFDHYVSTDVADKTFEGMSQNSNFQLSSTDLDAKGRLRNTSASEGGNIAPTLQLPDAPTSTKSWALTMEDRSAAKPGYKGKFTHWVVSNIPAGTRELKMVTKVDGDGKAYTELQAFGEDKKLIGTVSQAMPYEGPNPRDGKPHTYVFTLYALGQGYNAPDTVPTQQQLLTAMEGHILGQTSLQTSYSK